jgi:hypothetical protein
VILPAAQWTSTARRVRDVRNEAITESGVHEIAE